MIHIEKEILIKKLIGERQSLIDTSEELGVCKTTLIKKCKEYGIYEQVRSSSRFNHTNIEDLTNKEFEDLTVISIATKDRFGKTRWLCRCKCGNEKIINASSLIRKLSKSCGKCSRKNFSGYKDISGAWWKKFLRQASSRDKTVEITIEDIWDLYLSQNKKCAISGVDITFCRNNDNSKCTTASIDRIDCSKDYIKGNIHLVHKRINFVRGSLKIDDLILISKLIYKNNTERAEQLTIGIEDIEGGGYK